MVSTPTTVSSPTVDAQYRAQLIRVLADLAEKAPANGQIDTVLAIDSQRNTFTLLLVGWEERERVTDVIACLRIIDDRIWLEVDNVEPPLLDMLLDAGIPGEIIDLGYRHPAYRTDRNATDEA